MNETGNEDPIDEFFRMLGAEDGWSFKPKKENGRIC